MSGKNNIQKQDDFNPSKLLIGVSVWASYYRSN